MTKKLSVGVISLGCDKNRVDTEKMLALLSNEYSVTTDAIKADAVIINTCAFLQSSREEAIEEILAAVALKAERPNVKVVVTGCLPQKFIDQLFDELPEVDAFLGVSDYDKILQVLSDVFNGKRVNAVGTPKGECGKKRVLTTNGYAYLKIADGCSNHCTYCLIPAIRGKYRSVPKAELMEEVSALGQIKELILVAQDTTRYGQDLNPKTTLVELIKDLSNLTNVDSIRLLYCYPENISDELIQELKNNPKLIKYIDVPMQHADDSVLRRMNRKGTGKQYLDLVKKLKSEVEGIAIRSTFITGFPGESEQAFENLITFLKEAKLFNAGFFAYSREEGTSAYKLDGQIENKIKNARRRKLYTVQKKIVKQNLSALVNQTIKVFAEGFDYDCLMYYGRAYFNAPDIDGKVYFFSTEDVESGEFYDVLITKVDGYDLYGDRL